MYWDTWEKIDKCKSELFIVNYFISVKQIQKQIQFLHNKEVKVYKKSI